MRRYVAVGLLLLCFNAQGALNRWVDAEGKVHYSDEPPPANVNPRKLVVPSAASGVAAPKTLAEREAEMKREKKAREDAAQQAARQQAEAQDRQKVCNALRANLRILENAARVTVYNEQGEAVILDDDARQQRMSETRERLSNECK